MKLSVSLPDEAVEFLDRYARSQGYESRSAVVHRAVRLLQAADLGREYAEAWAEWTDAGTAGDWEATVGDGLAGN
jgi:Arc/MetJ-type ribon-helix-helix transcriptional regulator